MVRHLARTLQVPWQQVRIATMDTCKPILQMVGICGHKSYVRALAWAQVEYRERAAAGRRIPGNFLRREMGPSTQEAHTGHILTAAFAPLFPSGFDAPPAG